MFSVKLAKVCLHPSRALSSLAISMAILFPNIAHAGDQAPGLVLSTTSIPARSGASGGVFLFSAGGVRTGAPACATNPTRWAIDASLPGSQQTIIDILAAQAQGRLVEAHGTGDCSVWGDTETLNFMLVSSATVASDAYLEAVPANWYLQEYVGQAVNIFYSGSSCANGALTMGPAVDQNTRNRFWSAILTAKANKSIVGIYYETSSGACNIASFIAK